MTNDTKYVYWIASTDLEQLEVDLEADDITLTAVDKTACQTLNATGRDAFYAAPEIWSGLCRRQGSWYRDSARAGLYLVVSAVPLPAAYESCLDAVFRPDDFQPQTLPTTEELVELVERPEYQDAKPDEWERVSFKDRWLSKLLFTIKGFWGWGDNMGTRFLGHRANHANFLSRRYTTERDGQRVAYSVTDNAGVCSSCAEFFNVIGDRDRKLVRACPGSVMFAGLERGAYYDIVPTGRLTRRATSAAG